MNKIFQLDNPYLGFSCTPMRTTTDELIKDLEPGKNPKGGTGHLMSRQKRDKARKKRRKK